MVAHTRDEIAPSPEMAANSTAPNGEIPLEQPPKLKGRHRLLQSLQRMSSSPTLTRRGRSASTGYRRDHKASLSCVSLSSSAYSPCLGNGNSESSQPQSYHAFSPRPATPGLAGSSGESLDINNLNRIVGIESPNVSQPRTIPLPVDVRPASPKEPPCSLTPDVVKVESVGGLQESQLGSKSTSQLVSKSRSRSESKLKPQLNFWDAMPQEIQLEVFSYLKPCELVRCSAVSKTWNEMCYDGQLWAKIDTADYYQKIPGSDLVNLITSGGPYLRDLNIRGCVQMQTQWASAHGERIAKLCQNVVKLSLEGCRISQRPLHNFLRNNSRLEYINLSGLKSADNDTLKAISESCPQLEILNVSFCTNVAHKGLTYVVGACKRLKDLRASETGYFNDQLMKVMHKRNNLERLIFSNKYMFDWSLEMLMHGKNPKIDLLSNRPIAPPRRLRHLDLHQCKALTDKGLRYLAYNVPNLEGLQVSQCAKLTDSAIIDVIRTTPKLSHLELEDLGKLTNEVLTELAQAPCSQSLEHLNISFCESLGDTGMLALMKNCPKLRSVEMDNTKVSDLTLMEASFQLRKRGYGSELPKVGLRLVVFDCANVTWAGVREVLSSNARIPRSRKPVQPIATVTQVSEDGSSPTTSAFVTPNSTPPPPLPTYPNEIIQLKCFYGWQQTVNEHTKRVLRGDLQSASRIDRKWADYMMIHEEAGIAGAGARRRRRRAREAEELFQFYGYDEDSESEVYHPRGGRRRAQSGGCTVM
ncbi:hypothetical protein N7532_003813 [Penicillium argentinense]|uniref:F-box domain-containing protein n=1 Tax=Penicillium argentinense TaxID=1131581 RepID=A0A9W9FN57_9EURO|nr:uncharacterized protein N7532_003813 [Penicillium argentinense]KAJ5103284.1 hypothetical protein N7532_003813 [Penicillium argentinense]